MEILAVSQRQEVWDTFRPVFSKRSFAIRTVPSMETGLDVIRSSPPVLVILDCFHDSQAQFQQDKAHDSIKKMLTDILMVNAMIHTVVVSPLDEETFHDAMEGFGVLTSLPVMPLSDDINTLLDKLEAVRAIAEGHS